MGSWWADEDGQPGFGMNNSNLGEVAPLVCSSRIGGSCDGSNPPQTGVQRLRVGDLREA